MNFIKTNKNRGSTLLFVAMMISFLMVMALSVAQVILFEIKMGSDFASSQKAFYAKNAALELGILNKGNIPVSSLSNAAQYYGDLSNPFFNSFLFNIRGLSTSVRREDSVLFVKPKVVTSYLRSYALDTNGNLFIAGSCQYGEFGLGEDQCNQVWTDPAKWYLSLSDVIDVAAGFRYSIALKSDGTVWATGDNDYGNLGLGDNNDRYEWTKTSITGVVKIATGEASTYALKSDGTVWSVGDNGSGQLGIGLTGNSYNNWTQTKSGVSTYLTNVVDLGGSQLSWHIAAVKSDGSLWTAGYNGDGQLGLGSKDTNDHIYFTSVMTGIKKVSVGYYHTLVLDNRGDVWGVGDNTSGQLGQGSVSEKLSWTKLASDMRDIEAGTELSFLINSQGKVFASGPGYLIGMGWTDYNTFVDVGLNNVIGIAAAWGNSAAVKADGSYYATGDNYDGALGLWNKNKWDFVVWTMSPTFSL